MRLALLCGAACAIGCGHLYPNNTTSPSGDCVAQVRARKHQPVRRYVDGQQVDRARLDAVVSADPVARAYADRGARVGAGAIAAWTVGMAMFFGGGPVLLAVDGDQRYAGIGLLAAGLGLEVTAVLLSVLDGGDGQRALDRINQRARDVGRCPPGL
jgi:hypothetical protein